MDISAELRVDEIPYDFVRKRLSVVAANARGHERTLITKGALDNALSVCNGLQRGDAAYPLYATAREGIERRYSEWSEKGFREVGLATKTVDGRAEAYSHTDENALAFAGFLLFVDPPKADVKQVIVDLAKRGVQLQIVTGDNQKVARHVAEAAALPLQGVLTGGQLNDLHDEAIWHLAERTTLFAEVDPNQEERIILALQKTRHVVGYMGDGINDAPALHAADVGPSVDTAVDVAKDGALSFIQDQRASTQIGIVAFAGFAELILAPTADQEVLEDAIESLTTGRRTAIGSAILRSLDAIAEVDEAVAPSVSAGSTALAPTPVAKGAYVADIIVLLTDGASNAGPDPVEAAQQAVDRGVRVYTIGFGTEQGGRMECGDWISDGNFGGGFFGGGGFRRGIDEPTLMSVAEDTGGKYYSAESAGELQQVFQSLPTNLITKHETSEIGAIFVAIGALLTAAAVFLSHRWQPLP